MRFFIYVCLFAILQQVACADSPKPITDYENTVYQWFCKAQRDNGLLESAEGVDMCGLYQMSLAAMVFTLYGDYNRAEKIFDFYNSKLKEEFTGSGAGERGFIMFHHANGKPYYDTNRWLGDNAWFLMALNYYRSATGSDKYDNMAGMLVQWIEDLQDKKGKEYFRENDLGIWGGFEGAVNGKFMGYKSTEGCIDAYVALYPYRDKKELQKEIRKWTDSMYVPQEKRLKIGTTVNATDSEMQAWAYLAFLDPSKYSLDYLEKNFKLQVKSEATGEYITGFAYMPEDYANGRLEIAPTLAVILAYYVSGDAKKGDFYLTEIEKALVKSRFYPGAMGMPAVANKTRYPSDPTDVYNISVYTSAWYLFAKKRFNPMQEFNTP